MKRFFLGSLIILAFTTLNNAFADFSFPNAVMTNQRPVYVTSNTDCILGINCNGIYISATNGTPVNGSICGDNFSSYALGGGYDGLWNDGTCTYSFENGKIKESKNGQSMYFCIYADAGFDYKTAFKIYYNTSVPLTSDANYSCPDTVGNLELVNFDDSNPPSGSCSDGIQNQDETSIDYGGVCGFRTNGCEKQGVVLYDPGTNTQITPTFSDSWSNTGVTASGGVTTISFYDVASYNIDQIIIQNYSWDSNIDYRSFQGTNQSSYKTRLAAPVLSTSEAVQMTYAGVRGGQDVKFNYIRFKSSQTTGIQAVGKSGVVGSAIFYGPQGNSFTSTMTMSGGYATVIAQQRGTDVQEYTSVLIQFFKGLTMEIEGFEVGLANKITSNTFNCSNSQYVCSFKQNNYGDNVYCGSTYFDTSGRDIGACTSQNGSGSIIVDKYTGAKETIGSGSLVCTTSSNPTSIPKISGNTTVGYTTDGSGNVVISDPELANPFVEKECVIDGFTSALACVYEKAKSFFGTANDSANSVGKIARVTSEVGKATQSGSSSWQLGGSGSDNGSVPILSTLANQYNDLADGDKGVLSDQYLALKWTGIALAIIGVIVLFIFLIRQ